VTLPAPLAGDAETSHDPVSRSVLGKVSGFGAHFWRRGHAALVAAESPADTGVQRRCMRTLLVVAILRGVSRCGMGGCGFS
jgi:hypothetical protein